MGACKYDIHLLLYLVKTLQAFLLNCPAKVLSGSVGISRVRARVTGHDTGCLYFI